MDVMPIPPSSHPSAPTSVHPPIGSQPGSDLLVNSTISQDRTHGATAIEESNLQSLNRPLIALSLKSDSTFVPSNLNPGAFPEPAVIMREKASKAHRRGRSASRSSFDSRSTSSRRGPTTGSVINARKKLRDELEDEARLGSAPQLFLEAPNDGIQPLEGSNIGKNYLQNASLNNRMVRPLTTGEQDLLQQLQLDADSENITSSSSSDSEDFSDYDDFEGSQSDLPVPSTITEDTCVTETEEPSVEKVTTLWNDARRYRILCAIECSSTHPLNHHFALFYEDVPFKSKESGIVSRHLSGHIPIPSLKRYLETVDNCSFIVYRLYTCDKHGQDAPRNRLTVLPKVTRMSNKLEYREFIAIMSQRLERAILDLASCNPDDCSSPLCLQDYQGLIMMGAPYRFIYHHRTELLNYIKSAKHSTQPKALALLNYVDATVGAKHKRADDLFRRGITDFQSLNFLFKPNDILVVANQGRHTSHALNTWLASLHTPHWGCWTWTYDGSSFMRKPGAVQVPDLKNVKNRTVSIRELGTYPIKYAPENIRKSLKERGQKFWALRSQSYISYTGWDVLKDENHVATRCVIDYQTYRRFHPGASPVFCFHNQRDGMGLKINLLLNSTPSEEDFYLMPPNVHGFVLRGKKWVNLWVENVSEISWNKEAFERLVLPPKTKDLVKALVMVRASKQGKRQLANLPTKRDDIITSKGNGLIVLLHGGPGTGKTLTAERCVFNSLPYYNRETLNPHLLNQSSVAELAEMPLYRVTCGDIGTNAEAVEKYLQTVLYLGKTWNCVLLLDEADVFLEERTLSDLERNSLVSVFLRILEYYEGILILTSNRVGTFDEAFRSRMQLALHYPNLTPVSRKKIWQNFFDMLQEDGEDVDIDEIKLHIDELADKEMNGREIRNALITAKQLALYRKETLTWDHVEHTVRTAGDFNKYLKNVHGHTDEQRAREEGLR